MAEVTRERVDHLLAGLRAEAGQQAGRLVGLARATLRQRAEQVDRSARQQSQLARKTERWLRNEQESIVASHRAQGDRALRVIRESLAALAPGALSLDWGDPSWPDPGPATGLHIRLGQVHFGGDRSCPGVLPLIGAPGWSVEADEQTFAGIAHGVILRALVAFGVDRVRVHAFDPGLGSDLGLYAATRQSDRAAVPAPMTVNGAFEERLAVLAAELGRVEDTLASLGLFSIAEEATASRLHRPLQLLVIYGAGGALSQEGEHTLEQVVRVGAERGLFVLARADALAQLLPGRNHRLDSVVVREAAVEHSALAGVQLRLDGPPPRELVLEVSQALSRRPKQNTAPTLPLATLIDAVEDPWLDPGDEGIEVVYGRSGRADLVLRLRSQDPPMPNAVIGGAVGEGKSNLLLAIIYGLAARYSPLDLEMVLLDLKDGVEFAGFAPDAKGRNWLPHVRVLGLEFDRTFSLAVLTWLAGVVEQRGRQMREAGASNIAQYRRSGGSMPRLLVVIDEFQRLFEGTDEQIDQAALLLESLARTARSAGVHIVLASQTISGIRGLAAKSDAIFAQFHNRISLKNTAVESQVILAPHNTAAATLAHRGEVVANEGHGHDPAANVRGLTAHAERTYVRRLQAQLWSEGSTGVAPHVFRATSFAAPVATPAAVGHTLFNVTPGMPIGVSAAPRVMSLSRGPDQGVVVLGAERNLVAPVLLACVRSAMESRPDARVVVLDGMSTSGYKEPVVASVRSLLTEHGVSTRYVSCEAVAAVLSELQSAEAPDVSTLVLGLGLDGMVELEREDPETYVAPVEHLRGLVRTGGLRGIAVIGWWQSRGRAEAQLSYDLPGIRATVFCAVGAEDIRHVVGAGTRLPEGYPRVLCYDRSSPRGAELLVPFAVPESLGEVLRG